MPGIYPELTAQLDEFAGWRKQIHAHPETAFEEYKTAKFVTDVLESAGIPTRTGIARTGVVASLQGRGDGPSIVLRADLDALNMTEQNQIDHRSTHEGKMHACGHDGHTVMLLAAARHLAAKPNFNGTVHFVFQPAEENEGGGRVMVESGFFDEFPAEEVYGMHNWPALPAGEFAVHSGPAMASADRFTITLSGRGGHGAMPHQTRDPIVVAAQLVTALQTIVSRTVDPADSGVVSVTRINAGETYNVIPESAEIWGTTRSFKPHIRDLLEARLRTLTTHISKAFGVESHMRFLRGYPATINTPTEAQRAAKAAAAVVGQGAVHCDLPPSMGAEDFSYFLQERPGCYVWIGSAKGEDGPGLHHPYFDFNDDIIPIGASYWVRLVNERLGAA